MLVYHYFWGPDINLSSRQYLCKIIMCVTLLKNLIHRLCNHLLNTAHPRKYLVLKFDLTLGLLGFIFLHILSFLALSPYLSLISLLYPRGTRLVYFLHLAYANGDKHYLPCRSAVLKSERLLELLVCTLWKEGKKFKTAKFMQSYF